jgi:hypothetical protein
VTPCSQKCLWNFGRLLPDYTATHHRLFILSRFYGSDYTSRRGIGLTTGFIGSHYSYTQPSLLQLQLTLTTESLQGPGPPADPTGSHWPLTNSAGLKVKFKVTLRPKTSRSKTKSFYDRRSVGQSVLVSSPIWGSWPDINFCLTFTVLSVSGVPSDERSKSKFLLLPWLYSLGSDHIVNAALTLLSGLAVTK